MSENKELYLNFDEYIRQGEPAQKEKAGYWQAAIGLWSVSSATSFWVGSGICAIATCISILQRNGVCSQISLPEQVTSKYPNKYPNKFNTKNQYVKNLVKIVGTNELSVKEMLSGLGLKDRESFLDVYLNPAIKEKFVRLLYPNSPRHPRQKYLLTVKGLALYQELTK